MKPNQKALRIFGQSAAVFVLMLAIASAASAQTGTFFVQGGRTGVGIAVPTAPFEAVASATTPIGLGNAVARLVNAGPLALQFDDSRAAGFWNFTVDELADEFRVNKSGVPGFRMTVDAAGDMRVAGNFFANGVQLNVPDYVFEDSYPLMPLADLEAFVAREKHLPNIPAADEINKGQFNMTEMQMKLLEKVEELTLYTLAQQKTIDALQSRLETLER